MLEILNFIFSSLWTFLGTVILLLVLFSGLRCLFLGKK